MARRINRSPDDVLTDIEELVHTRQMMFQESKPIDGFLYDAVGIAGLCIPLHLLGMDLANATSIGAFGVAGSRVARMYENPQRQNYLSFGWCMVYGIGASIIAGEDTGFWDNVRHSIYSVTSFGLGFISTKKLYYRLFEAYHESLDKFNDRFGHHTDKIHVTLYKLGITKFTPFHPESAEESTQHASEDDATTIPTWPDREEYQPALQEVIDSYKD